MNRARCPDGLGHPSPKITGIGSLPFITLDEGIRNSYLDGGSNSIPYIPHLPKLSPLDYMIAHALCGFPGIVVSERGEVSFDLDRWKHESESHPPWCIQDQAIFSTYLKEIRKRVNEDHSIPTLKLQIAGPFTCMMMFYAAENDEITHEKILNQLVEWLYLRCEDMIDKVTRLECKIHPILFLDEPALCAFSDSNMSHAKIMKKLKEMIGRLKASRKCTIGLHCCGDTSHWSTVISLGIDILSFDAQVSLKIILSEAHRQAIETWIVQDGGRFCFGVMPTRSPVDSNPDLYSLDINSQPWQLYVQNLVDIFCSTLQDSWLGRSTILPPQGGDDVSSLASYSLVSVVLNECLLSPACGLALQTEAQTIWCMKTLELFSSYLIRYMSDRL